MTLPHDTKARLPRGGLAFATPAFRTVASGLPAERENAVPALAIGRAANLPIMLHNYTARMGEEYFARVGKSRKVRAIKESLGEMANARMLACNFPHIALFCGRDHQALGFLARGARSWLCAGLNFLPREHVSCPEEERWSLRQGQATAAQFQSHSALLRRPARRLTCVILGTHDCNTDFTSGYVKLKRQVAEERTLPFNPI